MPPPSSSGRWVARARSSRKLVPAFERAHPDLRVRVQQIPWSAAHEKLLTAFVGDSLPDVFQLGTTWIPELAALGALAPLDDRLAGAVDSPTTSSRASRDATRVAGRASRCPGTSTRGCCSTAATCSRAAGVASRRGDVAAWRAAMQQLQPTPRPDRHAMLLPLTEWEPPVVLALSYGAELLRDGDRYGNFQSDAVPRRVRLLPRALRARAGAARGRRRERERRPRLRRGLVLRRTLSGPWNARRVRGAAPGGPRGALGRTAPAPGASTSDAPACRLAGGGALAIAADRRARRPPGARRVARRSGAAGRVLPRCRATCRRGAAAWQRPGARRRPARAGASARSSSARGRLPAVPEWERIAARRSRAHTESAVRGERRPGRGARRARRARSTGCSRSGARCSSGTPGRSVGAVMAVRRRVHPAWLFVAPALAAIALFFFVPVVGGARCSRSPTSTSTRSPISRTSASSGSGTTRALLATRSSGRRFATRFYFVAGRRAALGRRLARRGAAA